MREVIEFVSLSYALVQSFQFQCEGVGVCAACLVRLPEDGRTCHGGSVQGVMLKEPDVALT